MLKPTTGTNPRHDTTDLCDSWVTFQTVRLPDGRVLLVQKRDGCTRTIPATR